MSRSIAPATLLLCGPLAAQNLVPNPSFEDLIACPNFASQLDSAEAWFNPTLGTPELYNGCAAYSSYVSVPFNATGGFQYAHSGQGYAGLFTWRTDVQNMREYAEVELLSPLQAGQCYQVEFHVNMPGDHPFACDGFGARFSTGPLQANNAQVLPFPAHIENPAGALITDTAAWTLISGVYTAVGGETHITLGNFKNDANTQTLQIATGTWYSTSAYLLLDDVSVVPLDLTVDLGPDTLICDGSTLLLDAARPNAEYLWDDGSTGSSLLADVGTHWVRVSVGACSASDTITISGGGPPVLVLPAASVICPGTDLVLNATTAGSSIQWENGDTNAIRIVQEAGIYTATATNACGSSTTSTQVSTEICPCVPYLPNAFTPNTDGINEAICPQFRCGDGELSWSIFDRWGSQVFTGADGACWDGTINGKAAPDGIYVWRARVERQHEADTDHVGHIVLLR